MILANALKHWNRSRMLCAVSVRTWKHLHNYATWVCSRTIVGFHASSSTTKLCFVIWHEKGCDQRRNHSCTHVGIDAKTLLGRSERKSSNLTTCWVMRNVFEFTDVFLFMCRRSCAFSKWSAEYFMSSLKLRSSSITWSSKIAATYARPNSMTCKKVSSVFEFRCCSTWSPAHITEWFARWSC